MVRNQRMDNQIAEKVAAFLCSDGRNQLALTLGSWETVAENFLTITSMAATLPTNVEEVIADNNVGLIIVIAHGPCAALAKHAQIQADRKEGMPPRSRLEHLLIGAISSSEWQNHAFAHGNYVEDIFPHKPVLTVMMDNVGQLWVPIRAHFPGMNPMIAQSNLEAGGLVEGLKPELLPEVMRKWLVLNRIQATRAKAQAIQHGFEEGQSFRTVLVKTTPKPAEACEGVRHLLGRDFVANVDLADPFFAVYVDLGDEEMALTQLEMAAYAIQHQTGYDDLPESETSLFRRPKVIYLTERQDELGRLGKLVGKTVIPGLLKQKTIKEFHLIF